MLLAMMILMMASYSSAYVRIENIYPSKIINLGDNSGIIIECQYNVRNFKNLLLMKSYSKVVFKIDYDKEKDIYAKTIRKDGFDCTSINSNEGQIICWKLNPTCEDATTYTCSSATEFSKPKTLKVKSYIKSLDLLTSPVYVNKLAIFRCTAYIGAPYGITDLVWFERKHNDTNIRVKKVNVQSHGKCLVPVVSIYNYTVKEGDVDETEISCFVNGASMTKLLINKTEIEEERRGETNTIGSEQKELVEIDNADYHSSSKNIRVRNIPSFYGRRSS
uniref:Ig-like domain-containing protein n=1 Tax=Octopus bimaculoides TaxID=37653 RepID=A0A0L8FXF0_OCTBM